MAEAIPSKETEEQCLKQEMGLKCRQCRSGFLVESKNESHDPLLSSTNDLYLIKDDELPEWISDKIEEAAWTKGRLNCPKCQCRVGGFDFVGGSEHPIHLIKSKVDLWKKTATTVIVTEEDTIVMLENQLSDSESSVSSSSSQIMSSSSDSSNASPRSNSSTGSMTSLYCSSISMISVSGSSESSTQDSAAGESSESSDALGNKCNSVSGSGDSSSENLEQIKISVKRKHKMRRRMTHPSPYSVKKMDRAKEKEWQEKRRHRKKEKLIKKILDAEPELDNLDASLMCPVCLDLLFDPFNVVPCKHTFCETCLRRIGSKDPMNTFCPMCRQRIVYCESQSELAVSIRESYPDLYKKRRTTEKSTNVYEMPLPWRPGWRNLVSGRALGGNPLGASTLFDYLKTIVQLLPYYVPPVVLANLINMVFFFVLLAAVEVVPFLSGLLQKSAKNALRTKAVTEFSEPSLYTDASTNMGITPNTFLNALMQRDTTRDKNLLMMGEMPLPPTYIPPESTQAMDATFYYIVGGMTLLAAAFGNIIILNFDD